jgi:hypothetical protein
MNYRTYNISHGNHRLANRTKSSEDRSGDLLMLYPLFDRGKGSFTESAWIFLRQAVSIYLMSHHRLSECKCLIAKQALKWCRIRFQVSSMPRFLRSIP